MKNLLAILLVLLIAGCGSPTQTEPEPEFEPYKVGTWWVTSPTEAEWEGIKAKATTAEGDTVILKQSGKRQLELVYDGITEKGRPFVEFTLSFTDSTITNADSVDLAHVNVEATKETNQMYFGHHRSFGVGPDRFTADVGGSYFCGESVPNGLNLAIRVESDTNFFRLYIIQSKGFVDVLNEEFCTK